MPAFSQLDTPRLVLRRFRQADVPLLLAYRNDPEVSRFQGWSVPNESALREFVAEMEQQEPFLPGPGFQIAVALRQTDTLIGDCYLHLLNYDPRQAELGYTLARAYWGQGYASEAVSRLLDEMFMRGMHRVIALTDTENNGSIKLLERLGMRREGHFLQSFFAHQSWRNEYQYALLASEWKEVTP